MDINALIAKYDIRVPRYTSYPTAPQFRPTIDAAVYEGWLRALPDVPVSLYLHVPFCAELCWFCGCNTTAVRRREPMDAYADTLLAEIDRVAAAIGRRMPVRASALGRRHAARAARRPHDGDHGAAARGVRLRRRCRDRGRDRPAHRRRRGDRHAGRDRRHPRQPRRAGFRPGGAARGQPACRASSRRGLRRRACARAASTRSIST